MKMAHPFTTILLDWFKENRRPLPWRETRDPYAIWLSEVILQQTRIQQGTAYWERFMRRWPSVESLAAATEDEVLREWQGLGYYSRARNLHAAARQIVELGHFPDTMAEIRRLKGVGDYTAAAIASIAFDLPEAVVDGNVYRVLSRHFGIGVPINSSEGKKTFATLAQELLPTGEASAFNQAMMDFGAVQCTPKSPRCSQCPLAESCVALREGRVEDLPVKLKTLTVKTRHLTYVYLRCQGQTAIRRRGAGDIWQGLWEPYSPSLPDDDKFRFDREKSLLAGWGRLSLLRSNVKHVLTHRILLADFYLLECDEKPTLPDDFIWIPEADIDNYGVPRLVELLLETVAKHGEAEF